ncbi:Chemotaxis protein CheW [compost metagenome]
MRARRKEGDVLGYGREQFIQFEVGQNPYAVHISDVQEIIKLQEISALPNAHPYVKGVIQLRERIIPVISLSYALGLCEEPLSKHARILIIRQDNEDVGILVDRVNKVAVFDQVQPMPDTREAGGVTFIAIGISDQALVGILKFNRMLV